MGKANRTWQVVDKEKGGESLVLKDIWLVRGAPGEHDIWSALKKKVDDAGDKADKDVLCTHFVPVETGWCVEKGTADEDIPDNQIVGTYFTIFSVRKAQSILNRRPASQPVGEVGHHDDGDLLPSLPLLPKHKPRRLRRSHWRVLYKSVPLTEFSRVKHVPTILATLEGTNKGLYTRFFVHPCLITYLALQLLWKYRWIHRDISAGNVYYDAENKVGRISDYEYCKQYSTATSPAGDVKTVRNLHSNCMICSMCSFRAPKSSWLWR